VRANTTISSFDWISTGAHHTCAISNYRLYCWGSNSSGQLGDGTLTDRLSPVQYSLNNVLIVAAGEAHTCAVADPATPSTVGARLLFSRARLGSS
jgi:alpha-tubulin suppressor-like RCC1 family protein